MNGFARGTRPWLDLPRGQPLPQHTWNQRHRFILALGCGHALLLPLYGVYMGESWLHSIQEGAIVAALVALAALAGRRTTKALFASVALIASSAVLVHLSGGYIEAHFHFFVALAIITLYQEWVPFVATVAITVVHHGVVGVLDPTSVYNHPDAIAHPWKWAGIHGLFVLGACLAYVVQWRLNEEVRDTADLVLDAAGEAIVGVDRGGRITFANPAAVQLLGQGRPVLERRPIASFLTSSAGGTPTQRTTIQTRLLRGDVPVEVTTAPMEPKWLGSVLTIVDLRPRMQEEAERLRQRDEQLQRLKEVDEMKNVFMNRVAHELRTPLTPLRVQARLIREGIGSTDAAAILDRNLERLNRLVDDVLDITRMQSDHMRLRREDLRVAAVLRETVALYTPIANEKQVGLSMDCDPTVWVHADPMRFAQALNNLVANAIRCSPGGHVHLVARQEGADVLLRVEDDGAGLTREQMGRLFQAFSQIDDGSPEQRDGTGLGLYVAQQIARLHGGTIEATSDGPGRGCVFTLRVPSLMARIVEPAPQVVR